MLKPSSCKPCVLYNISDGFSEPEGQGTSGVAIVGEALGYQEYIDGLPFRPHAESGSKLEEAFKLVALETGQPCSRGMFKIYNMVNCRPPGNTLAGASFEEEAVRCCSENVDRVIGGFRPRVTLALGNVATKYLCGVSGVAEEKQSVTHLRGYVLEGKYGLTIPSLHPSYIRRGNGHLTPLLVEDIKRALAVARGQYSNYTSHKEYKPPVYQTTPGVDDAWSFYYSVKDNPRAILSYDIETIETGNIDEDERDDLGETEIVLVQFSTAKGSGIALPWKEEYLPIIFKLFALPNPKANHNTWNFDNPRLKAKGVEIVGKVHDTMWCFKHWHPKLPRGLQSVAGMLGFPFPWKHLYKANLNYYGCADVDAVQWIMHTLPALMQAKGVWTGYRDHVYNVHPIFERATEHGIPVDEQKRVEVEVEFKQKREKLDKELQLEVPEEIRNIKPKRKDKETGEIDYGYLREPKQVQEELENYDRLVAKASELGKRVISYEEYLYRKHNLAHAQFRDDKTGEVIERWCIVENFKASSTQLIKYLKWKQAEFKTEIDALVEQREREFQGRNPELTNKIRVLQSQMADYEVPKVPTKTKDGEKRLRETTNSDELEEIFIKTGDPILEKVMKIRSLDTNINNFLPNWKPKRDGRAHPIFGFSPPTGQINSWNPNGQNLSKHTDFGNEFRAIIEAPPGYCFVDADKRSFHVATMGFCANDKDYIRFSQIDPHSILGSYIDPSVIGCSIDLRWSDADIKIAAKEFKKRCKEHKAKDPNHNIDVRQELAKPTVLGNQLELGAKKLQRKNRRFIHYVTEIERRALGGKGYSAEGLQKIIANLFPKEDAYKIFIKDKAHRDKFLTNEFGRIQYFYDVYHFVFSKKTGKWTRKDGSGARQPIAFAVQSRAFGMITEELLKFEQLGLCEKYNYILTIHDSLVFMPKLEDRDKCIADCKYIMSMPCKQLVNDATGPQGLIVDVEVATGLNWKAYNKETNPHGMVEI